MSKISFVSKTVIITGSSSGIGAETALLFSKLGANLILTGRNADQLKIVKDECIQNGLKPDQVIAIPGDITDEKVQKALVDAAIDKFKRLDVLVNNAGLMIPTPLDSFDFETYDRTQSVNVRSVIKLSLLATPYLKQSKGNIVNVSSTASIMPNANMLAYNVSKAALDTVTKTMAFELALDGVRVNSVVSGPVLTNIVRHLPGVTLDKDAEFWKGIGRGNPSGRIGTVSEIAESIVFLASENASYTTGAMFAVDGGYTICGNRKQ